MTDPEIDRKINEKKLYEEAEKIYRKQNKANRGNYDYNQNFQGFGESVDTGSWETGYEKKQTRQEYQEYKRQERHEEARRNPEPEHASSTYFAGCTDTDSIKKRYRDLCKVYHPDAGNGDPMVFAAITEEYNTLMGK